MLRKLLMFMAAGLCLMLPLVAHALGFGSIQLKSALNERLDAEVELLSPSPEDLNSLKVQLASQAAYMRAGIERSALAGSLIFEVKQRKNEAYYIHISSKGAVREPFVNFLLEMSWKNGRMIREYTVLLDPPARFSSPQQSSQVATIATPAVTEPVEVEASTEAGSADPFAPTPIEPVAIEEPEPAPVAPQAVTPEPMAQAEQPAEMPQDNQPVPVPLEQPQDIQPEPQPVPVESTEPDIGGGRVFADNELFPTIPLTEYRESAGTSAAVTRAEPTPVDGDFDYGLTRKNDKLWNIAERLRPNSNVSIYQVMMALVKANPNAFVNGNPHRLKVGHVLRIDDPALLTAMSKQQAARAYQLETREWDEYRQAASGKVNQQPVIAKQVKSETVVAKPADKGELTLASPDGNGQQSGEGISEEVINNNLATLKAELTQMREQAGTTQAKNDELNSRIHELEDQLANMQRTISIKDSELAELQKQLTEIRQKASAVEATDNTAAPAKDTSTAESPSAQPATQESEAESVAQTETVTTPVLEEPAAPGVETPATTAEATDETAQQSKQPVAPATPAQPQPQAAKPAVPVKKDDSIMGMAMGWVDQAGKIAGDVGAAVGGMVAELMDGGLKNNNMIMYIAGGAAALILLLSLLIVLKRRRQGESFQESILKGTPASADAASDIPSADLARSEESSFLSDFAVSGAGNIQTEDSEVDPLTEADVFMAYGRYEAAEERLQEAIQSEPDRQELKLKLLELYKTTENKSAFENTAEDIYASLAGNTVGNPAWDKVVSLGKQVAPDNPLFKGDSAAAVKDDADDFLADSMSPGNDVMDIGLETGTFDSSEFSESDFASSDFSSDLSEPSSADAEQTMSDDLDFNLDFGETTASSEEPEIEDTATSMDFNLDFGDTDNQEQAPLADLAADEESASDMASLDFDLNIGGSDSAAASPSVGFDLDVANSDTQSSMPQPAEESGLDFNLDMTAGEGESSLDNAEPEGTMMLDMGDGFDLGMDSDSDNETAMDFGLDASDATDLDMSMDGDEVNTKLDLAKAYIDMGDPDGAKSILDEVMDEGNEQQKNEAQQLMQQIA